MKEITVYHEYHPPLVPGYGAVSVRSLPRHWGFFIWLLMDYIPGKKKTKATKGRRNSLSLFWSSGLTIEEKKNLPFVVVRSLFTSFLFLEPKTTAPIAVRHESAYHNSTRTRSVKKFRVSSLFLLLSVHFWYTCHWSNIVKLVHLYAAPCLLNTQIFLSLIQKWTGEGYCPLEKIPSY